MRSRSRTVARLSSCQQEGLQGSLSLASIPGLTVGLVLQASLTPAHFDLRGRSMRQHGYAIDEASVRDSLPARKGPCWASLGKARALGFRKSPTGIRTWVARWTEPEARNRNRRGRLSRLPRKSARGERAAGRLRRCPALGNDASARARLPGSAAQRPTGFGIKHGRFSCARLRSFRADTGMRPPRAAYSASAGPRGRACGRGE
jgi:hypothetical protein